MLMRGGSGEPAVPPDRKKAAAPVSLPDEMITEVLQWLPVKSVLRFRAVCRSWPALLSSDEFRSLHTAAGPAPPKLLYISPTPRFDSTAVYSRSFSPSPGRTTDSDAGDLLFTIDGAPGNCVEVVTPAPCHGLNLLYDALSTAYYICNPATRAAARLPPSTDVAFRSTTGLGFDARTREHKVVRLINETAPHNQDMIRCEVYTPGSSFGDRWRPASVPSGLHQFVYAAMAIASLYKLPPVFANGCLHWLTSPSPFIRTTRVAVLSFSVTEETFTCLQSPSFGAKGKKPASLGEHLVEMDDQLYIVGDLRKIGPAAYRSTLEIWKLLDYTSGDWSLNHRISLSGHMARELGGSDIVRVIGSFRDCRSSSKKIIIAFCRHNILHSTFQKKVHCSTSVIISSEALETILSITEPHSAHPYEFPGSRFSSFQETLAPVHKTDEERADSSALAKATREILLRLPAKSAIRSKLVCKQCLRLIESENFIQSYSAHKNMDKRPKVMLVGKSTAEQLAFTFAPLNMILREAPRHHCTPLDTKVVCSKPCHGLNLVSTKTVDYLCNPCTGFSRGYSNLGQYLELPCRIPRAEEHAFTVGKKNVGLTFDPLTREHVVVEMFYHRKDFESRQYYLTCALRWCSSHNPAQQNQVPPLPVNDMPPAYLEGMLYWMSEPRLGQSCEWAVASFNIVTKMFDVIPCPSWFGRSNNRNRCRAFVVELEGALCSVLADPAADSLDVWKLKHGRWDRAYTIHLKACPDYSLQTNVVVPLAVDPDCGKIILNTGRKIGLYDPAKQLVQTLYSHDQVPVVKVRPHGKSVDMHSTSSGNSLTCSKDHSGEEMSIMDTSIIPFVPMLYEENIVYYSRVARAKFLW